MCFLELWAIYLAIRSLWTGQFTLDGGARYVSGFMNYVVVALLLSVPVPALLGIIGLSISPSHVWLFALLIPWYFLTGGMHLDHHQLLRGHLSRPSAPGTRSTVVPTKSPAIESHRSATVRGFRRGRGGRTAPVTTTRGRRRLTPAEPSIV